MPISSDIRTEGLLAQFRAQRSVQKAGPKASADEAQAAARVSASGLHGGQSAAGSDRVDISLSANLTVEAANGILNDSVVEQINRALQEAGIDLTVEEAAERGLDVSPEATAHRIVDFAVGFSGAYRQNHATAAPQGQVHGFMSLLRGAIQDGFQHARDFLSSITKLSDTIDQNITRTFELVNAYLEEYEQAQLELAQAEEPEPASGSDSETDGDTT